MPLRERLKHQQLVKGRVDITCNSGAKLSRNRLKIVWAVEDAAVEVPH